MPNVTQTDQTFKIACISQCCFPRENCETSLPKLEPQHKKSQHTANCHLPMLLWIREISAYLNSNCHQYSMLSSIRIYCVYPPLIMLLFFCLLLYKSFLIFLIQQSDVSTSPLLNAEDRCWGWVEHKKLKIWIWNFQAISQCHGIFNLGHFTSWKWWLQKSQCFMCCSAGGKGMPCNKHKCMAKPLLRYIFQIPTENTEWNLQKNNLPSLLFL